MEEIKKRNTFAFKVVCGPPDVIEKAIAATQLIGEVFSVDTAVTMAVLPGPALVGGACNTAIVIAAVIKYIPRDANMNN